MDVVCHTNPVVIFGRFHEGDQNPVHLTILSQLNALQLQSVLLETTSGRRVCMMKLRYQDGIVLSTNSID